MVSRDRKRCFLYFTVRRGKRRVQLCGGFVHFIAGGGQSSGGSIHFLCEAKGVEASLKIEEEVGRGDGGLKRLEKVDSG